MELDYVDNYLKWLKNNTLQVQIDKNISRLTFPFVDNNNTATELYIINNKDNYTITDDGYTFSELELVNFDFNSGRRKSIIDKILNNYAVNKDDDNALYVECTKETLALKKHLLIQCILKINDLTQLSHNNIKTLFNEEVENFMLDNDIRYTKDIVLIGKSKLQSNYDFTIGRSKRAPERIIKLIKSIDSNQVKGTIFSWEDVKENRDYDSQLITIINDPNRKASKDSLNAFKEYNIKPLLWSERDKYKELLSA